MSRTYSPTAHQAAYHALSDAIVAENFIRNLRPVFRIDTQAGQEENLSHLLLFELAQKYRKQCTTNLAWYNNQLRKLSPEEYAAIWTLVP